MKNTPGISTLASSPTDEFFCYLDPKSPASCQKALSDLDSYIASEGPFDGVMAFSQGAGLAASLMIYHQQQQQERRQRRRPQKAENGTLRQEQQGDQEEECLEDFPTFKCAIFFSGGEPMMMTRDDDDDETMLENVEHGTTATTTQSSPPPPPPALLRTMNVETDGEVIDIPTAHIWGKNDQLYPTFGPVLSRLCKQGMRVDFLHEGGHELPRGNVKGEVEGAVLAIRKTVERALLMQ